MVIFQLLWCSFACHIASGSEDVANSDTIKTNLGDLCVFLPTMQLYQKNTFKAIDSHSFLSPGIVQICATLKTVAEPCRFRYTKAFIMACEYTNTIKDAYCSGEIELDILFWYAQVLKSQNLSLRTYKICYPLTIEILIAKRLLSKILKHGVRLITSEMEEQHPNSKIYAGFEETPRF